jgi:uncharacterized membrane protein YbhN (UPF0104 family)
MRPHLRQIVFTGMKFALAAAILTYLIVSQRSAFAQLSEQPIDWRLLAGAQLLTFAMTTLSIVRWHILLLALGFDVRLVRTLRLGAVGFALNFVSPGAIGGDFFKAIFLAHDHPERRPEAIATIVADRIMGLLTMLLMATFGIFAAGLLNASSQGVRVLARGILLMSAGCWGGVLLLMIVGPLTGPWIRQRVERFPITGRTISRLLATVQVYRGQKAMLLAAFSLSMVMGVCYVSSYYVMALGIPSQQPTFAQHFVIVPMSGLVGSIPITPSGLGTTEATIAELYRTLPGGTPAMGGQGMLVAIGRRLTDVVVAIVGLVFYLSQRREVNAVYAEALHTAELGTAGGE